MSRIVHYATKKLKKYRDDRDWSQQQLADFLSLQLANKISRSTIQKWENQERGMNAELALDISKILDIPVMELVERKTADV